MRTEREEKRIYYEQFWPIFSMVFLARPLHFWSMGKRAGINEGDRVLEIGAGYPLFRMYSQRVGDSGLFVSLDYLESIQRRSQRMVGKFSKSSLQFVTADGYDLPFQDESFDIVLASNFSGGRDMHMPVEGISRVLKPGGRLLASWNELGVNSKSPITISPIIEKTCKEAGFINVTNTRGAIGSIALVGAPFSWNWIVEATKPN